MDRVLLGTDFPFVTKQALKELVAQSAKSEVLLNLTDGRTLRIAHPDYVLIPPSGDPTETDFIVVQPETPNRFQVIALPEVVSAVVDKRVSARTTKP
ncbi:MAG TPA: hypothetical protein PLX89_20035 [Verrucomicrobiota bacterium]|nr:hypothetical protein [Verrucomicrobiota bacterium]